MAESGRGGGKYSPKASTRKMADGSQQWVRGETLADRAKTIMDHVMNTKDDPRNKSNPLGKFMRVLNSNYAAGTKKK